MIAFLVRVLLGCFAFAVAALIAAISWPDVMQSDPYPLALVHELADREVAHAQSIGFQPLSRGTGSDNWRMPLHVEAGHCVAVVASSTKDVIRLEIAIPDQPDVARMSNTKTPIGQVQACFETAADVVLNGSTWDRPLDWVVLDGTIEHIGGNPALTRGLVPIR